MQRIGLSDPEGVRFVPPRGSGTGVLVLAGSSGRIDEDRARVFAELGHVAESIRWFGGAGQQPGPGSVPLELFLARIDDLKRTCDRVWLVGTSLGAEAALVLGALRPSVAGVIAFAPTDVVWPWPDDEGVERSHWTLDGSPLPHVPLAWDTWRREEPPRFRSLYEHSYEAAADRVRAAAVPVERIPQLVLIAGEDDQVWPSAQSVRRIAARRAAAGHTTTVVIHRHAGHRAVLPTEPVVAGGIAMVRGGTATADAALGLTALETIRIALAQDRIRSSS
ncbi:MULTISPECIES: acyl-CoA thioester hydrolase/BAAT C-terminal domain-containing protein [Curtobacterium]|uniref:acyl-CoA thioester hydrolase/BAAT C-terminal domain-containing protein n=1 Tax=Curtobacterium TaxID=2034 RepID=UPI00137590BD|nr:acyl-CoA thioester hydrolase/BAAT C-terminal domain-containing protein [Curtobacterium flaccumfaciens]MBT1617707.1 alpha/beta fold hydrolase [Curtobacterium flaccumfaciens pv. poinsettiae]MDQ0539500.1 pimeloyl-ACP methyl ester carboxylesterase [Curtobacterium flaccumfaciens]